jgi:hypothetical protein
VGSVQFQLCLACSGGWVHRQLLHQAEILGVVENICLRDDLCDCLPTTIKIISPQFYCVVIVDARDIHKTMH